MTAPTTTRPDAIQADIRQLVSPIVLAAGRRVVRHPPLLDQLRQAAVPGRRGDHTATRHAAAGSRPPARLDAVDVLSEIYVGISGWHARLRLPSPPEYRYGCDHPTCQQAGHETAVYGLTGIRGPMCVLASVTGPIDWQAEALAQLARAAPDLDPPRAEWFAVEVHTWWADAATVSGWSTRELVRLR